MASTSTSGTTASGATNPGPTDSGSNSSSSSTVADTTIDLSEKFLDKKTLLACDKNKKGPITRLVLERSVLGDKDHTTGELIDVLQQVLQRHASTLKDLRLNGSNVTGRLMYKGRAFVCEDPEQEHVTVESTDKDGHPVVRDDDPPRSFEQNSVTYQYVKTSFVNGNFLRYYVALDWLQQVETIDMANCTLSGYGLTSLCAATASTLLHLRLASCPDVDDKGMVAIARLCKRLVALDISNCPKITPHGALYLGEMPPAQVLRIKEIHLHSTVTLPVVLALSSALEEKGFTGMIYYGRPLPPRPRSNGETSLRRKYLNYPERITSLALEDITRDCLLKVGSNRRRRQRKPNADSKKADNDDGDKQHLNQDNGDEYALNLSGQLINDTVLELILNQWGPSLVSLDVSGTYITEHGLAFLNKCPHLRTLKMARCWAITDKQTANRAIMPAVNGMLNLRELDISDTRISGRMLSKHPRLMLEALNGARSPMSVHAVRMLTETCFRSMRHLNFSGCNFLNTKSIHYILRFLRLETLDLSHCAGLTNDDVMLLQRFFTAGLSHLGEVNVSGVRGMNGYLCQELANELSRKTPDQHTVRIIWSPSTAADTGLATMTPRKNRHDEHKQDSSVFVGETVLNQCPYTALDAKESNEKGKDATLTKGTNIADTSVIDSEVKTGADAARGDASVNSNVLHTAHALAYTLLDEADLDRREGEQQEGEEGVQQDAVDSNVYSSLAMDALQGSHTQLRSKNASNEINAQFDREARQAYTQLDASQLIASQGNSNSNDMDGDNDLVDDAAFVNPYGVFDASSMSADPQKPVVAPLVNNPGFGPGSGAGDGTDDNDDDDDDVPS